MAYDVLKYVLKLTYVQELIEFMLVSVENWKAVLITYSAGFENAMREFSRCQKY